MPGLAIRTSAHCRKRSQLVRLFEKPVLFSQHWRRRWLSPTVKTASAVTIAGFDADEWKDGASFSNSSRRIVPRCRISASTRSAWSSLTTQSKDDRLASRARTPFTAAFGCPGNPLRTRNFAGGRLRAGCIRVGRLNYAAARPQALFYIAIVSDRLAICASCRRRSLWGKIGGKAICTLAFRRLSPVPQWPRGSGFFFLATAVSQHSRAKHGRPYRKLDSPR